MAEWGKLYGTLHGSPKWRRASKGARALWTTAMSWCVDQESSDGEVPSDMLKILDGTAREAATLVEVGLWDVADSGWRFHDWDQRQRTAEQIKRDRESAAERQRRARAKRDSHSVTHGVSHAARTEQNRGEQNREERQVAPAPDALPAASGNAPAAAAAGPTTKGSKSRGTRVPQPFPVTADMVEWARRETPGLNHAAVTERFVDYWAAVAGAKGVKLDWVATWRNWLRREAENTGTGRPTRTQPVRRDQWLDR